MVPYETSILPKSHPTQVILTYKGLLKFLNTFESKLFFLLKRDRWGESKDKCLSKSHVIDTSLSRTCLSHSHPLSLSLSLSFSLPIVLCKDTRFSDIFERQIISLAKQKRFPVKYSCYSKIEIYILLSLNEYFRFAIGFGCKKSELLKSETWYSKLHCSGQLKTQISD